jgi:ABC-type multidrug transport system ATPase subunit
MSHHQVLKVEQLCLSRGGKRLAAPLDLQLQLGQVGLLRGGNGSGKTTLMETLCGLLPVDQGTVEASARIGYGMQEPRFPDHLGCAAYLRQLHALGGGARSKREQEVRAAMDLFQLEPHATDAIGKLSRGWRQRLNLARAWLGKPDLLLLDEPQTALDPSGMEALHQAIKQASEMGVLIVAPEGVGCDDLGPLIATLQREEGS